MLEKSRHSKKSKIRPQYRKKGIYVKVKIETKIQIEKGYKRKIKSPTKKWEIKVQIEKGYKSPNRKGK